METGLTLDSIGSIWYSNEADGFISRSRFAFQFAW